MRKYDLFAIDIDGTLMTIGENARIPESATEALRRAREAGINCVIATGRTLASASPFHALAEADPHIIVDNGASLMRIDGEYLWKCWFPKETIASLLAMCEENGVGYEFYQGENTYINDNQDMKAFSYGVEQLQPIVLEDYRTVLTGDCPKILLMGTHAQIERCRVIVGKRFPEAVMYSSYPGLFEIVRRDAHKGAALRELASRMGIPMERLAAIGDNANDIQMIKEAGLGLAMGNASAEVKAVADVVLPHIEKDGFAHAVERYLLG